MQNAHKGAFSIVIIDFFSFFFFFLIPSDLWWLLISNWLWILYNSLRNEYSCKKKVLCGRFSIWLLYYLFFISGDLWWPLGLKFYNYVILRTIKLVCVYRFWSLVALLNFDLFSSYLTSCVQYSSSRSKSHSLQCSRMPYKCICWKFQP